MHFGIEVAMSINVSKIKIYYTTLRDGMQAEGVTFSLEDKLLIAKRLDEFGIDYIEGGFPLSNPKETQFFQRAAQMEFANARVAAFGSTKRVGVKVIDKRCVAIDLGLIHTHLLTYDFDYLRLDCFHINIWTHNKAS